MGDLEKKVKVLELQLNSIKKELEEKKTLLDELVEKSRLAKAKFIATSEKVELLQKSIDSLKK